MTIALDATMLILLFDEHARAPIDPSTNSPVTRAQERIRQFVNAATKQKGSRILIPTPALAEFMVRVKPESAADYVNQLQRIRGCHIAPFSIRAAIEASVMIRHLLNDLDRNEVSPAPARKRSSTSRSSRSPRSRARRRSTPTITD